MCVVSRGGSTWSARVRSLLPATCSRRVLCSKFGLTDIGARGSVVTFEVRTKVVSITVVCALEPYTPTRTHRDTVHTHYIHTCMYVCTYVLMRMYVCMYLYMYE